MEVPIYDVENFRIHSMHDDFVIDTRTILAPNDGLPLNYNKWNCWDIEKLEFDTKSRENSILKAGVPQLAVVEGRNTL